MRTNSLATATDEELETERRFIAYAFLRGDTTDLDNRRDLRDAIEAEQLRRPQAVR